MVLGGSTAELLVHSWAWAGRYADLPGSLWAQLEKDFCHLPLGQCAISQKARGSGADKRLPLMGGDHRFDQPYAGQMWPAPVRSVRQDLSW